MVVREGLSCSAGVLLTIILPNLSWSRTSRVIRRLCKDTSLLPFKGEITRQEDHAVFDFVVRPPCASADEPFEIVYIVSAMGRSKSFDL